MSPKQGIVKPELGWGTACASPSPTPLQNLTTLSGPWARYSPQPGHCFLCESGMSHLSHAKTFTLCGSHWCLRQSRWLSCQGCPLPGVCGRVPEAHLWKERYWFNLSGLPKARDSSQPHRTLLENLKKKDRAPFLSPTETSSVPPQYLSEFLGLCIYLIACLFSCGCQDIPDVFHARDNSGLYVH